MSTPAFIPDSPARPAVAPSPAPTSTPAPTPGFVPDESPASTPAVAPDDPSVTGEITNDVGNKVIVPKTGENFGDTIQRAVDHYRSMSPQDRKAAIDRETATIPKKAAETAAGAAGVGFLGPALLAAPGEALMETHAALNAGIKAFIPALTSGVTAVGQWAEAHPVAAKAIWETLKLAITGTAIGTASKIAGKIIKSSPDE